MASQATRLQDPERAALLREAFARTAQNIHDFDAYNEADAAFHYEIMEQSGIRLAANITRILFARARESSRFTGSPGSDAMTTTLEEHRAVLEAIVSGDADGAAEAMRSHISSAWERRRPR